MDGLLAAPKAKASGHSPPTVSLTGPANNASFAGPATVSISASAAATGATISEVDFYRGSTLLGTVNSSPYTFNWTNVATGTYSLSAKATDSGGAIVSSGAISITVIPKPATATITAPANNAVVQLPITITASAQAGAKPVMQVDFWSDLRYLGSVEAAPCSFTWTNAPPGNHSLTVQASDTSGIAGPMSSPVVITVPMPPSVTLSSAAAGAVQMAPGNASFVATATSPNGSITKVEFYNGQTLLSTSTVAPYTFSLSNLASGNYPITAKATDSAGLSGTSDPAIFAVDTVDESCGGTQ